MKIFIFLPALAFLLPALGALGALRWFKLPQRDFWAGSSLWFCFLLAHSMMVFLLSQGVDLLSLSKGTKEEIWLFLSGGIEVFLVLGLFHGFLFFQGPKGEQKKFLSLGLGFGWAKLTALGLFQLSLGGAIFLRPQSLPLSLITSFSAPFPSPGAVFLLMGQNICALAFCLCLLWMIHRSIEKKAYWGGVLLLQGALSLMRILEGPRISPVIVFLFQVFLLAGLLWALKGDKSQVSEEGEGELALSELS